MHSIPNYVNSWILLTPQNCCDHSDPDNFSRVNNAKTRIPFNKFIAGHNWFDVVINNKEVRYCCNPRGDCQKNNKKKGRKITDNEENYGICNNCHASFVCGKCMEQIMITKFMMYGTNNVCCNNVIH